MNEKSKYFETYTIKPKKLRGAERLEFIKSKIIWNILAFSNEKMHRFNLTSYNFADNWQGVMEGYSYGSIGRTFELGELGGMIKMLFFKYNIPLEIVPPTVWKKEVIGKGNVNKDKVKLVVIDNYGLRFKTQDECDSFCLAEYKRRKIKNEK